MIGVTKHGETNGEVKLIVRGYKSSKKYQSAPKMLQRTFKMASHTVALTCNYEKNMIGVTKHGESNGVVKLVVGWIKMMKKIIRG